MVPLLLFGLASAFFLAGRWPAAALAAAVRYWRLWVVYGIMLAGRIVAADILPVVLSRLGNLPTSLVAVQARYLMEGNEVRVRLAQPGPALCITGITVGSLKQGQASQASPAVPTGAATPA